MNAPLSFLPETFSCSLTEHSLVIVAQSKIKVRAPQDRVYIDKYLNVSTTKLNRDNQANESIVRLVAKSLAIAPSSVTIKSGQRCKNKLLQLVMPFRREKNLQFYIDRLKGLMALFMLFCFSLLADESADKLLKEMEVLESVSFDKYLSLVLPINERFDQYVDFKSRICQGELSPSVIKQESGGEKLSEEEKKICWQDLQQFKEKYVTTRMRMRKRYLNNLHQQEMLFLEQLPKEK